MEIRIASDADEKDIKAFSAAEWPEADAEHFGRKDVVFDKKKYTFVAIQNEQITGYIIIETDMGVCYIDSIITAHAYRGTGVGKALIQIAEEKALSEKCHKMFLITGLDWKAKAFYASLGYNEVTILKKHYNRQDFVQMEKLL